MVNVDNIGLQIAEIASHAIFDFRIVGREPSLRPPILTCQASDMNATLDLTREDPALAGLNDDEEK